MPADDPWQDFYDGQTVGVDEWIAELERMLTAELERVRNGTLIAGSISPSSQPTT